MQRITQTIATLFCICAIAFGQNGAKKPSIDDLKWLAGCWESSRGARLVEEVWMKPAGGSMMGMGRTTASGKTAQFEFMRIHEENGEIRFTAKPSGQPEASFKLISTNLEELIFENPQHDYPQRVIYRKQADGSLAARIEGQMNGKSRAIDFPYKRGKCE